MELPSWRSERKQEASVPTSEPAAGAAVRPPSPPDGLAPAGSSSLAAAVEQLPVVAVLGCTAQAEDVASEALQALEAAAPRLAGGLGLPTVTVRQPQQGQQRALQFAGGAALRPHSVLQARSGEGGGSDAMHLAATVVQRLPAPPSLPAEPPSAGADAATFAGMEAAARWLAPAPLPLQQETPGAGGEGAPGPPLRPIPVRASAPIDLSEAAPNAAAAVAEEPETGAAAATGGVAASPPLVQATQA
jgi:hypothetical protein